LTKDEVLQALASRLPSDRMAAASWLATQPVDDTMRPALTAAAAREDVPRIRFVLQRALRATKVAPTPNAPVGGQSALDALVLAELAGIIQHEMEPAIGWVRYAAHGDISEFTESATNVAIEGLRRRVAGLVQLADAHRQPVRERVSLIELLNASIPQDSGNSAALFSIEAPHGLDDSIHTDPGLFELLVRNAMQNAVDAVRSTATPDPIYVTVGVTDRDFWISIANRHPGSNFEFVDVAASGVSSKAMKRGLGTQVMSLVARRLEYDIDLKASGGTVTFTVHGRRNA
jgi:hypothetical protein